MKTLFYSIVLLLTTHLVQGQGVKKAIDLYENDESSQAETDLQAYRKLKCDRFEDHFEFRVGIYC